MKNYSKIFLVFAVFCILWASLFTSVFEASHQLNHAHTHTQPGTNCSTCVYFTHAAGIFKFMALALIFAGILTCKLLRHSIFLFKNLLNKFLHTPVALKVKLSN